MTYPKNRKRRASITNITNLQDRTDLIHLAAARGVSTQWDAFIHKELYAYYEEQLATYTPSYLGPQATIKDYWPLDFVCPLTRQPLRKPVKTPRDDVYELEAIQDYIRSHHRDPYSHYPLREEDLRVDKDLEELAVYLSPRVQLNSNIRQGMHDLHDKLKPIFKKGILSRSRSYYYQGLFIASIPILFLAYLYCYEDEGNNSFFNRLSNQIYQNLDKPAEMIDQLVLLLIWMNANWKNFLPPRLTRTNEEKNSFALCNHYSKDFSLELCAPAWLFSVHNIYYLHLLCLAAGDLLCVQMAMDLNITEENTFKMMDLSYYSGRLLTIEQDLPLIHGAWEANPEIERLLHYGVYVNQQNQYGISALVAFMLGQVLLQKNTGDPQLLQHAQEAQMLLSLCDINTCHNNRDYKPYFRYTYELSETIASGNIIQRKDLLDVPELLFFNWDLQFYHHAEGNECQHHYLYRPPLKFPYSRKNSIDLLKLLLRWGGSLVDTDRSKRTPEALAREYNLLFMMRVLEEHLALQPYDERLDISKSFSFKFFNLPERLPHKKIDFKEEENDSDEEDLLERTNEEEEEAEEEYIFEI